MRAVEVKDLRKSYNVPSGIKGIWGIIKKWRKKEVIKGISFSIKKGEFVGLIGPNGSGKTTTIKMLTGILVPDSGYINVLGFTPWHKNHDYLKRIGVLFGNRSNLVFDVPIIDSLLLFKEIYEIEENVFKKRLEMLSNMLGIKHLLNTPVRKLSLGQRMRAEIASIFLHKPDVVFLDEPTIGLDVVVRDKVHEFLTTINKKEGTTILLTTHNIQEIELLCKRSIVIKDGTIVWDGNTAELKNKYMTFKEVVIEYAGIRNKKYVKALSKYKPVVEDHIIKIKAKKGCEIDVVSKLLKAYEIKSMRISEPELEDVIKQIYGEKE